MQVERVADMQVGDFIQLPAGEWHKNKPARDLYDEAQQRMRAAQGSDAAPQYQVDNEDGPGYKSRLVRIR